MLKRVISAVIICMGSLLILAAVALVGYNMWDDSRAETEMNDVLSQLHEVMKQPGLLQEGGPADTDDPVTDPGVSSDPDNTLPLPPLVSAPQNVPDYVLHPEMEMPAVEIDGNRYIGTITLPVLGLEFPVMEEWSLPKLKKAPCRYSGTAYMGNMIICAHNYRSHFGKISNLRAGDIIIFTDVDGNVFTYEVKCLETLATVEELQDGEWDLTLFTCTLAGNTRVTVRCVSVD